MEPPRLISMEVTMSGRCDCYYRILADRSVKYVTVKADTLSAEALDDMYLNFQNVLPPLPYYEDTWKSACVTRNPSSGQLEVELSSAGLPGVQTSWHPRIRMIAKMARFPWEVQYVEAETRIYKLLAGKGIAPEFLAHVHEGGRIIGVLIPDGRNAEPSDLKACQTALRRFHMLGLVHGDCNKYNFIIRPDGQAVLIDFDHSMPCTDPALLEAEMASLEAQLAETTGRGGGFMSFDEEDSDGESGE
ncbi:alpha-galactosidase A [Nemania abortiva]|nr:alpha-galactosidase A [Nemania abortiva]